MGTPKAWLVFGGEPMLVRVTRVVASVAVRTIVVAQKNQPLPPLPVGCEAAHDQIPDAGPLAGITAGLATLAGACDAALVASCDHPLLTARFLRALKAKLGDHPAVIPIHEGRTYPLLGIYRTDVLSIARRLLDEGERRLQTFAAACNAFEVEASTLANADDLRSLINVNDAKTLEAALRQTKPGLP
jgi:molybdopterin-guanine dinucleotide biosynthesis protein A